jgi:hypothetical protein
VNVDADSMSQIGALLQGGGLMAFCFIVWKQGEKWGDRIVQALERLGDASDRHQATLEHVKAQLTSDAKWERLLTPPHGVKVP